MLGYFSIFWHQKRWHNPEEIFHVGFYRFSFAKGLLFAAQRTPWKGLIAMKQQPKEEEAFQSYLAE
jgi:hypothetical protein